MKTLCIAAVALGMAGGFLVTHAAKAQDVSIGLPGFAFSFNTDDVAYAYRDGYWDHDHHWHRWHNDREWREYRSRYTDHYDDRRHDRVEHEGWREEHRG